jgi:hypothetical protein
VWWDEASFNRVVVVMRGNDQGIELMDGVRGWRIEPWDGWLKEVGGDGAGASATPYGASAFVAANAVGPAGGSVAIGHPPCAYFGYASAGSGAVRLTGGHEDIVSACPAPNTPPAAAMPGSAEWRLSGATAGITDVPARLVVVGRR